MARRTESVERESLDLATLRDTQELLATMLRQIPEGVLVIEASTGRVLVENARVREVLGTQAFDEDRVAPFVSPLSRTLITGEEVLDEEIEHARNGERITLSTSCSPLRDATGRIVAGIVTLRDVTQHKRERQERERLLELEQASRERVEEELRAREELLAIVSHDLQSPLGLIQMSAAMVAGDAGQDDVGDRIRARALRIQRAADRMSRLIRDLLDAASLDANRLAIRLDVCNVGTLLNDALELLEPIAEERSIRVSTEVEDPEALVTCDRARIAQVLGNLVSNAIKFTPEGGMVTLRARLERGEMRLGVQDTGPGIPAEQAQIVFERYWRGQTDQSAGLGLGLYIARGIVEAHGGRIWMESQPGQGASFHFTLPTA